MVEIFGNDRIKTFRSIIDGLIVWLIGTEKIEFVHILLRVDPWLEIIGGLAAINMT